MSEALQQPTTVIDPVSAPVRDVEKGLKTGHGPKYIFLGIGGVMSTMKSKAAFDRDGDDEAVLDPAAAKLILRLQRETGAKIVLASRYAYSGDEEREALSRQGFTPEYAPDWRVPLGEQTGKHIDFAAPIYSYCKDHGVRPEDCVVIAQNPRTLPPELAARTLKIDVINGLSHQNFREARAMLTGRDPNRTPGESLGI